MDTLATAAREEGLKRAVDRLMELVTEARDVAPGGKSLCEFSEYAARLRSLLQELRLRRVEATTESDLLRAALQSLEAHVSKACEVIRSYKSCSRLGLLLNSRSMSERLQDSTTDIARAVQLLDLGNLVAAFDLKSKADEIVRGLESLEFKSAIATEAVVSELEKSITNNGKSLDYKKRLLQQIAEAVGARPVDEIALLKREIEELEERKQHAEALQLSQLMQLLYSSEMVPGPSQEATPASTSSQSVSVSVISSFTCSLSGMLMEDPVAILCGHSFERHSIMEHFGRGDRRCPTCKEELHSLELTRNISLRNSIQEWKQRTAQHKLQSTLSSLSSGDRDVLNQALEDLCFAMETTDSIDKDMEQSELVLKLVGLLKTNAVNTKPALKCLCNLARCSDENKEVIAENGAIRFIVKKFCRGETEPEAVEVLLELSQKEALAEHIGNTKDSIPTLVSLLQNQNPEISQKAGNVLGNLSFNTHFVIKMAEARHFKPFLACFYKGRSETRASMATALTRIQLSESTAKHFEDEQFISALTKTLYSNSPASKSACLRCIRKLTAFHILVRRFLADRDTIPALLGLISPISSETHWKQEATEILISLVRASQPLDYQTNPSLQELHSEHNIHVFLQLASTSTTQTKVSLLGLLLAMVEKSEIARELIRSDASAMACLFSNLQGDHQSEVRLHAMKLIYCVAEEHPAWILLPPSPAKESIVIALATIFTSSPNNEERAAAAGIIGRLPSDDTAVNDMLMKPEALKAIHEVISAADDRHWGMTKEPSPATTTPSYLLENALAALLQYTEPTKPELQRQVAKLELCPSLVRVLSTGSPLAKQRTALVLARLSQATQLNIITAANTDEQVPNLVPLLWLTRFPHIKSWCCSSSPLQQSLCSVHGSGCSARYAFCLIKADAVRPLVQTLSEKECGASEAALMALDTLLMDDRTLSSAATAIVESHGADAILEVLEKGSQSAKEKAFDLFPKIFKHLAVGDRELQRSKSILIHLLQDDALKKKAAFVLSQMDFIPQQSSYF